ncbi:MAG: response regulator [Candidatus Methanoplasma sp.]|jgi:DNA-binding response OmpR family regulator|nr:response regulator [Candidatus Methanoplasma sp.]
MKVLIVDDNVAIRDVLREVLEGAGYEVDAADSADTAVTKARDYPDVIILDIDISEGESLGIIDRIHEWDRSEDFNVLLMRSGNEQIPRDNAFIRGYIQKPFRSSEILNKVASVIKTDAAEKRAGKEPELKERHPASSVGGKIEFGTSYVFFQGGPGSLYDTASSFDRNGYNIFLVTAGRIKTIREKLGTGNTEALQLSVRWMGGYSDIYKLGTAIEQVRAFIARSERPVVVFDNLDPLIDRNGINSVLMMLHQVLTTEYGKKVTILASVDSKKLTDKDRGIILKHMSDYYNPTEE